MKIYYLYLGFILSAFVGCKDKDPQILKPDPVDPAFNEYVGAFTSGYVSSSDPIIIQFSKEVDSVTLGKAPNSSWFKFTPNIEGVVVWMNSYTLKFMPSAELKNGQVYKGTFELNNVFAVPSTLNKFPLYFVTSQQDIRLSGTRLSLVSSKSLNEYKLEGSIITEDDLEDGIVEQLLKVKCDNNIFKVTWTHSAAQKKHTFTLTSIGRKQSAQVIEVSMDGKPAGLDKTELLHFTVPGVNEFGYLNYEIKYIDSDEIILTFSDKLSNTNNFEDYISIEGEKCLITNVLGNTITVKVQSNPKGTKKLVIKKGLKSTKGSKTTETVVEMIKFSASPPAVEFLTKGSILPNSKEGLVIPFSAVSLNAVDVRIMKIFSNNTGQYLQVNALDGNSELARVSRTILYKKIPLNLKPGESGESKIFSLDLSKLISVDLGAIYRVELSFRKSYYDYDCSGVEDDGEESVKTISEYNSEIQDESSLWSYYEDSYSWNDREDPCKYAYYNSGRWATQNIIASNLGFIAKSGSENSFDIYVSNLRTTSPIEDVQVTAYNYQLQKIGQGKTGGKGYLKLNYSGNKPYLLEATKNGERSYLKVDRELSLSTSMFDVSGSEVQGGIKGFLYGERGVWRPGDTIHVSFFLGDNNRTIPLGHPIKFEFRDPQQRLVKHIVKKVNESNIYTFPVVTNIGAPTGNWSANVYVGGASFSKTIKVETIKPNRLKIKLTFPQKRIKAGEIKMNGNLEVKWLQGSIAKNLDAKVSVVFSPIKTKFDKYPHFVFDDPSKQSAVGKEIILFDDPIDENGKALVQFNPDLEKSTPTGMLKAVVTTRVFEKGGDFSINQMTIPYAPYDVFVGILPPKGDDRNMVLTGKSHDVNIVTLDGDGNPVPNMKVKVFLNKVSWRWWWDTSSKTEGLYSSSKGRECVQSEVVTTNSQGKAKFTFRQEYPEWGRYFISAELEGRYTHSTGSVIYIDWPGWAKRVNSEGGAGAKMLRFTSDKSSYKVGEMATISMPSSEGGSALISIENGSKVLQHFVVKTEKDETAFKFEITSEMTPNIYVNISLLQPHAQIKNDLPIRLYGIIPLMVEDSKTILTPKIITADEYRSEKEISIDVKEESGKSMFYTLSVVDEGLLDITNYTTPDPWKIFYAREALGVRTWDIYDYVIGSFGGRIESLFAVGGGADGVAGKQKEVNRFKPVVKFLGPFELKPGATNNHKLILPMYIGSVKVMIVAKDNKGAYGSTDKVVPVKDPLMILATMPRSLSPQERVKLPVTVFSMSDKIKKVHVKVEYLSLLKSIGITEQDLTFDEQGEKDIFFDAETFATLGVAKLRVIATSGSEKAEQTIELNLRPSNPIVSKSQMWVLNGKESLSESIIPFGVDGTNKLSLEFSSVPPINLGRRLSELITYPHGCIEQTISSVFPQLYLSEISDLSQAQKDMITSNVKAGIDRIMNFQTSDGGFSYWPGSLGSDLWGSNYAGNFLLEAEKRGYVIPSSLKRDWLIYQKNQAFRLVGPQSNNLDQAYRLYTLALAGKAELGLMNRLREIIRNESSERAARWELALAYILVGQKEVAVDLLDMTHSFLDPSAKRELAGTYGSYWRDKSILLELLVRMDKKEEALEVAKSISQHLNKDVWMSTQETAYNLMSMSIFAETNKGNGIDISLRVIDSTKTSIFDSRIKTKFSVNEQEISERSRNFTITNNNDEPIFVVLASSGSPLKGNEISESKTIGMEVEYIDETGNGIDVTQLSQGTDFIARVTISNISHFGKIENLALTQIFPSGWEITNTRLYEGSHEINSFTYDYLDIRDDRVMTYFSLSNDNPNKIYLVYLTAAYVGSYYLPAVQCSAMYDNSIYATEKGMDVEVTK